MTWYSGYIVASPASRDFTVSELVQREPEFPNGPTLHHRDLAFGFKQWNEFVLQSSVPLADESEIFEQGYRYQVFFVFGYSKMIILSSRKSIVDYALAQIIDRRLFPNVRKVAIFIDRMIENCGNLDAPYLVTSLHGQFSGPTAHLKRISLYGEDVTQSSLYVDQHHLFNFRSAGLGHRHVDGRPTILYDDGQIVRVANDGSLNINLNTRQRARELMEIVNFIMTNHWVEGWVPLGKGRGVWPT